MALGVLIAAGVSPGIRFDDGASLVFATVLLSFLNIVLKPLLMLFSLPFIMLTFGIGIWLINALLFLLTAELVPGFSVAGFGHALIGALIVSLTGLVASLAFGSATGRFNVEVGRGGRGVHAGTERRRRVAGRERQDDDVIDV